MTETIVYGNTWLRNTVIIFILNKYVEIKVTLTYGGSMITKFSKQIGEND